MSVHINGFDIIESNTVVTDEEEKDLYIDLEYKGDKLGTLHLIFVREDGNSGIVTYVDNNQMIIKMINFYDMMERFTLSPIMIGTIENDRKIKVHIMSCVRGDEKKIRITTYTVFLEREKND